MFSEPAKKLQERFGSRATYERMAQSGAGEQELGLSEAEFIAARDSFYMATVTLDGWPYVQHRGGAAGFLRAIDERTLAFADYSGNKQYITAGNLTANDRVALFLMDYPNRTRLKIIGHAKWIEPGTDPKLEASLGNLPPRTRVERIFVIDVVGFDWNCNQHITPRYTMDEMEEYFPPEVAGKLI
jgi:predicted pyridoxine 5'-phosphate oxidase superfamily flavin-nucleotide-binding protein